MKETQWGSYIIGRRIGKGGMAEVYEARKVGPQGFQKPVAIKRILPTFHDKPEWRSMFSREAQIAAQLNHPNIIQVYDFGEMGEAFYITMEYVDGVDLVRVLTKQAKHGVRMPTPLAVFIVREVLAALQYAHSRKGADGRPVPIVHRDISPSNVLISYEGKVKLTDFGIAKSIGGIPTDTVPGIFKGKIHYVAPEQLRGEPADIRTDLYSSGILLYILLNGHRPFEGQSADDILSLQEAGKYAPIDLEAGRVSEKLAMAVQKSLKPDRPDRYQRVSEFLAPLDDFLSERTDTNKLEERLAVYIRHLFKKDIDLSDKTVPEYVKTDPEVDSSHGFNIPTHVPQEFTNSRKDNSGFKRAFLQISLVGLAGISIYFLGPPTIQAIRKRIQVSSTPSPLASPIAPEEIPTASETPLATHRPTPQPPIVFPESNLPPQQMVAPRRTAMPKTATKPRIRPTPAPIAKPRTPARQLPAQAPVKFGWMSVLPNGPFARVFVDGTPIGDTPIVRFKISEGRHQLVFENIKAAKRREMTVTIEVDENLFLKDIWGENQPPLPAPTPPPSDE